MIISRRKLQEEKEQAFNEAMRRRDEDERFRYLHERIDRLEKTVYKLQASIVKPEENELKCCTPVRG